MGKGKCECNDSQSLENERLCPLGRWWVCGHVQWRVLQLTALFHFLCHFIQSFLYHEIKKNGMGDQ